MGKAKIKDGILTCGCGSTSFRVGFQEPVWYDLAARSGKEGWGKASLGESCDTDLIIGIICQECDADIEITKEAVKFIRKIGG